MTTKPFPQPTSFFKMLGPSFVILALGLGSGEVILWPYLSANYGLGIVWGALLGLTCQYFINMEIERYALVKGESVFSGLARRWTWTAYWFIISTFFGWALPGIAAASAQIFGHIFNIVNFRWIAIGILIAIGLILTLNQSIYKTLEKITKTILLVGIPCLLVLAAFIAKQTDWLALFQGVVGRGQDYNWLPQGVSLVTFLAAFAYSGAGGNLNLSQSIYIKDKGYGMGFYAQKLGGLFRSNKTEAINLSGTDFALTPTNLDRFRKWWRKISLEHLLVFWLLGFLSMSLLMILSYSTAFGGNYQSGIGFIFTESLLISQTLHPSIGLAFLILLGLMLAQTQLGVLDSTSRIMAENAALIKIKKQATNKLNLSKYYYACLWGQIIFGTTLFLFNFYEPKQLIVTGAIINALAMFVHIGLVNLNNWQILPQPTQPTLWRKIVMAAIFLLFAAFGFITLNSYL
ncbi:MAG TPA: Nramp family divalent metal transporter [bacterium]|nr:Nramp family divalent metal transporter [bacterium]